MTMFTQSVKKAPRLVPRFNIGCLFDIMTGDPVVGIKGETIINGGFHHLEGAAGEANSAKTGLSFFRGATVVSRYTLASMTVYDPETTLGRDRIIKQAKHIDPKLVETGINENGIPYEYTPRIELTTPAEYTGDEFYAAFKKYGEERPKLKADYVYTPFQEDITGLPLRILPPQIAFIDSFSKFGTKATEAIQEKAGIGETGQNMLFMRDGLIKTQMMNELPSLTIRNGLYFIMTAQIGENKQLDPYSAPRQTLSFLKNNLKLKRVPDEYRYNVHNLLFNFAMRPLLNATTKAPEYPRDSSENESKNDSDLQTIMVMNLRGKSGSSGKPITIIYSQSEGVKASLTEFHHIKEEGFGVTNKQGNYTIDLMPDYKVGRTTIRQALETDVKLCNAVRIMSEMLQASNEWRFLPKEWLCTPKELYEDIKAKGYDWDELLNTRGYWTFDQYTHPVPFLSFIDLLKMRVGLYHPYWMESKK